MTDFLLPIFVIILAVLIGIIVFTREKSPDKENWRGGWRGGWRGRGWRGWGRPWLYYDAPVYGYDVNLDTCDRDCFRANCVEKCRDDKSTDCEKCKAVCFDQCRV